MSSSVPRCSIRPARITTISSARKSRLQQVVRDEQRRHAELSAERRTQRLQLGATDRVERAERLVHEQHARAARRWHARAPRAGAARRRARADSARRTRRGARPTSVERLPRRIGRVAPLEQLGHERRVAEHSPVRQQAAVLRHVADAPPQLRRAAAARRRSRRPCTVARRRHDHAIEAAEQRGLSCAALADEGDALPRGDAEAHAVHGGDAAEHAAHVAGLERRGAIGQVRQAISGWDRTRVDRRCWALGHVVAGAVTDFEAPARTQHPRSAISSATSACSGFTARAGSLGSVDEVLQRNRLTASARVTR